MTQLLQEAPPASLTADQDKLLRQFYSLLWRMEKPLLAEEPALLSSVVTAMLQRHAARSAGTLVAWATQRPEQLMSLEFAEGPPSTGACPGASRTLLSHSTAALGWAVGIRFLGFAADAVSKQDAGSAAASQMTADMTQQLHQSGRWGMCCYTVELDKCGCLMHAMLVH
jgi:hypothetical protein